MEYEPIRIPPPLAPRVPVRRYTSEPESGGSDRDESFRYRSHHVPSYRRQPLPRRSSFNSRQRTNTDLSTEPDDGKNRRTHSTINLGRVRQRLVDEEQNPQPYSSLRKKPAQSDTDDVRATQRANVKDIHIRRSRRAVAEDDENNPIILETELNEAQHNSDHHPGWAHWRHMEGNELSLKAFRILALQTPGLDGNDMTLISRVLERWGSRHEKEGVDGCFLQAGAIHSVSFDPSRQRLDNESVTFFCLPWLSIDPPTQISHYGAIDKSLHPIRTLLQWRYHSFSTKDRDNQTLAPCKGGVLHVPQMWGLIVNSKRIITAAPFALSHLKGTALRIEEGSHTSDSSLIQFISIDGPSHYFLSEQCMTWFEMMGKVQSTFNRPEDLTNFDFFITDTQNTSRRVFDRNWSAVIASKRQECVALSMKYIGWETGQRKVFAGSRKDLHQHGNSLSNMTPAQHFEKCSSRSLPAHVRQPDRLGTKVGGHTGKQLVVYQSAVELANSDSPTSPITSSEKGDSNSDSGSEGQSDQRMTDLSKHRPAPESRQRGQTTEGQLALVPYIGREDSLKHKETAVPTEEPLKLIEWPPDELTLNPATTIAYRGISNRRKSACSESHSSECRTRNHFRSRHSSEQVSSVSESGRVIPVDNTFYRTPQERKSHPAGPLHKWLQPKSYVFDKKSSTYQTQQHMGNSEGSSVYYSTNKLLHPPSTESATSSSESTRPIPGKRDKAKQRARSVEVSAEHTENIKIHLINEKVPVPPVFTWPIETPDSQSDINAWTSHDEVSKNIVNELNRSLSRHRKERAAYISIVECTQQKAESLSPTIHNDSKLFKRKQSFLERANQLSNFFVPNYYASSITGKYWGSVLSLLTLENEEWGVELLKHCSRQLKTLLEVAEEIQNGVMSNDSLEVSPYRIPAALVKAYRSIVMLLITTVIHQRKLSTSTSLKRSTREYKEELEDVGTDCLGMMQEGKDQLMRMIHTKDLTGSVDYKPVSTEAMMAKVMENALQGTSASGYPHLFTAYNDFIMHLELQVREKPRRRLLKQINNTIEQLEVIDLVLLDQKSALSDYQKTLDHSANDHDYLAFSVTATNIEIIKERRQDFLELKWRASDIAQQLVQSLEILKDDHGKAILVFTIVTIIFLPMSFVTGLLGMNTSDIRNMNKDQDLFWSISLPLTASVLVIAIGVGFQENIRQRLKNLFSGSGKRKSS